MRSCVADTLCLFRERKWILKGRQTVKQVISNSVKCLKLIGSPYARFKEAPLPYERENESQVSEVVCVYFIVALNVTSKKNIVMVYIVWFIDAVSRAVHLAVVYILCETIIFYTFYKI